METKNTIIKRVVDVPAPREYEVYERENKDCLIQSVKFQRGPVKETGGVNGVFIEDLILICIDQIEHFQTSEMYCKENESTLRHLRDALYSTRARQYERSLRGVQGIDKK